MTQLDKNIALNLKRIRKSKNMSLDMLAERTGVSKSMLGQIERGESNPTVSTIGKIVEAPIFKEKEGQYRIYVMLPFDAGRNFEIYQGELDGKAQMESESYGEQTREYLTVVSGEIELILDDQSFHVKRGSSLYFACDRKHVYRNAGEEKAVCNMIITTQH